MKYAIEDDITEFVDDYGKGKIFFPVYQYSVYEKEIILEYMTSLEPNVAVAGPMNDCVTGKRINGEFVGYSDGEYSWNSQDIYHIKIYNAAVSDDFLHNVLNRKSCKQQ